jgi:hypothetical protein
MFIQQYEINYESENGGKTTTINYGVVDRFLVCSLGDKGLWGRFQSMTQLLAVITPCKTNGQDASRNLVGYKTTTAPIVTDVRNIVCLIGRVHSRGSWWLVDRSMNLTHGTFASVDKEIFLNEDLSSEDSD